jgi:hypothetical protein
MGLPREAENLVILTFAEQTNRSFFLHGAPFEATLTNLPDPLELREQKLPGQVHWDVAAQRAGSIFGVAVSPLLKASNVTQLATGVQQKVAAARRTCQTYCQRLRERLGKLEIDTAADRMQTAAAVLAVVERLHEVEPGEVVGVLATADVATSESAMGECFSKAAELAARLDAKEWEILEATATLPDERKTAAEEIVNGIRQALASDEHVMQLAAALKEAQAKAVRLLTQPIPPPALEPAPKPMSKPGRKILQQGSQQHLDIQAAYELMTRLERELQAGQKIHFDISWIVEEGGAEQ